MAAQRRQPSSTPRPLPASGLLFGAWYARWGDWVIHLREQAGKWQATVWRWTTGGGYDERMQLGVGNGFTAPTDAVEWACDLLRENGASTFVIDRPDVTLETLLRFNPAPEAVT